MRIRLVPVPVLLSLIPVVSASITGTVKSAEPTCLSHVRLWIYPEYDDLRLLVMQEGKGTGATVPATVRFSVPSAAEMYSAGSMDARGNYSGGPPARKHSDVPGWDEINYDVKTAPIRYCLLKAGTATVACPGKRYISVRNSE